jgi:hypothetical protein
MKSLTVRVALAAALLAVGIVLAVATGARGAAHRALAPDMELTQTCSQRVEAGATIEVQATLSNTGDTIFHVDAIDADAGTPGNDTDNFIPRYRSGDANDNEQVDPGENWVYGGAYTAPTADVINNVAADATTPAGFELSDVAPCETDIIQQPEPGRIVGVRVVRGKILVKKPGTGKFVELAENTEIPVGTQVNALNGTIALTAGLGGGRTNTAEFYAGKFTILQPRAANSYMTLRLDGGNFRVCGAAGKARSLSAVDRTRRPVRRLWGSGKGRFASRGRYSAATVRGTKWLVQDQCNGTLTRVLQGVVRVRDFRLRKNVNVRAGRSYLARAPGA